MLFCDIGKSLDESAISIQTVCSFDGILVAALADNLLVELVKSLNVVRREGNRHKDHVGLAAGNVARDGIRSLRA